MPNFRFTAFYPRIFPAVQDDNGKSLVATEGMVVEWEFPPCSAEWSETTDAATWPAPKPTPKSFRDQSKRDHRTASPEAKTAVPPESKED